MKGELFFLNLDQKLQSDQQSFMKLILKRALFKRKTLLIFFIALVLPLTIVAYLGFDTLVTRHNSTKNILESNLWITGESILNQLEEHHSKKE